MIRFALDEDFDDRIAEGVLSRNPAIDILDVKKVGMRGASDHEVLEWAAREGRVLLSHDRRTMRPIAENRVSLGLPMSGLIIMPQREYIGQCVNGIIDIHTYEDPEMWDTRVDFLPKR